ncbi:TonB-dependent receptor [Flavobacterium gawalongense]|uniref:TonB-dependent receptor n=1 Tax=Flavobacterium gawalongense TaxID=2594432 RepID=A0A553BLW2_9FLAO|nr:TonB-dependent receptor [Flavobacterium gawalongense]TRX01258.1 TonB-dependent receptor [Flavobacterium gawalongense]TRX01406.1 TonB-dependent receptor [Flavobacterium gawalongense]TRX06053.1 TonB-dependent receptor [Flavobacterium gawalongense]TRX09247.1 TonB-dependent receptor [Flavobacterium gawalongense]TRX21858.1 TonB-dependent receptor [Flavobacterium gawalongense]
MKKFIIALFLGFSAMLHAQNSISGTVTDMKSQPIKGVSVYASELHKGTTTDENGKYALTNLPNGKLKLTFTFIGFGTQNKTITSLQKENTLDVILEETIFEMDEVIVSTAFNKIQSQNVMKVEHESIKNMQRKGTATLIEGLATIPGVSQVSTGTSIGKPVIRGLSGNRVLVYSQGVRIENQQFGDEHGLGLNDSGIESVEVIKGPASLLYGSDALGGVLYFNPEKFADASTFKTNFSQKYFSNTLGSNSSLGLKTSTDNWKFLARGSYNIHSDYKIADGERVTNTRYNETDFKTGIGYSNAKFSSVLRYNYNDLDLGIPEDGVAEQTTSKKTGFPKQGVFNHLLSLNNVFFFQKSKLDVDLGYVANDRSEFEDSDVAVLHMKLKTFNYDAKYHLPIIGEVETIFGIQGMHQTNTNSGEEYLIPDATTNDFGFFGTANYEWKTNVLQAGLRFDNRKITTEAYGIPGEEGSFEAIDKSYDSFNASLGYKTNLADDLTLRLNLASGFRAPNLAELTSNGVHEGTNRYEVGNSDLETEQNVQTDLNLEYRTDHFEFFVNGFYNHVNNYIYTSPTGIVIDENAVFDYIQNDAKLYGGEIGLHLHPHPLDWLHYETSFENVTGKKQNGDYLPLIPANNWNNTIRTEFKIKNWLEDGFATLNVSTTFNQNNVSGFETESNGYSLVNLGFGGKVKLGKIAFDINLNGNNVLDKRYIAHLSRLKTDRIPNIGRNVVLGVNFNL